MAAYLFCSSVSSSVKRGKAIHFVRSSREKETMHGKHRAPHLANNWSSEQRMTPPHTRPTFPRGSEDYNWVYAELYPMSVPCLESLFKILVRNWKLASRAGVLHTLVMTRLLGWPLRHNEVRWILINHLCQNTLDSFSVIYCFYERYIFFILKNLIE